MKIKTKSIIYIFSYSVIFLVCASLIAPKDGYFVFLYGKKQFVNLEGKGSPTLIFFTGKGIAGSDFKKIINKLKKTNQCFSYDRAGLGLSQALPSDRRIDTMACELYQLLQKEKIKPPFILVGHALGTYIARYFVNQYPLLVKGMMLIEPANENEYYNGLEIRSDSDKIVFKEQYKSFLKVKGRTKTQNAESIYCFDFDSTRFSTNQKIMKKMTIPCSMPITILLSLKPDVENEYIDKELEFRTIFFDNWKPHNKNIKILTLSKTSHFLHRDEPSWVADEILELIKKTSN